MKSPTQFFVKEQEVHTENQFHYLVPIDNIKPIGIITPHDLLPIINAIVDYYSYHYKRRFQITSDTNTKNDSSCEYEINNQMYQFTPWARIVMTLASDLMNRDPLRVTGDLDLAYSTQLMIRKEISGGILVVDSFNNNDLVGIITLNVITMSANRQTNESGDECILSMALHQFLWAGKSVLPNSKHYILQSLF